MELKFRVIVIFTAFISILLWEMPYIDYEFFSDNELSLLNQSGFGSSIPFSNFLYWGSLAVWLLIYVGIYLYSNVAKFGFIVMCVVSAIATAFYGIQVYSPYESVIGNLLGLANGAILAMSYLSPIGDKFAKNS